MFIRRRGLLALVVVLVAIAVVVGGLYRQLRSQETAVADAVLDAARQRLTESQGLNRIPLAEREFARAAEAVVEAEALFATERSATAAAAAEKALNLVSAARSLADERRDEGQAAVAVELQGRVTHRGAERVSWVDAVPDMSLFDGDRVVTAVGAEATLRFGGARRVRIAADSVVVVRRVIARLADVLVDMDLSVVRGILDSLPFDRSARQALVAAELAGPDIVVRRGQVQLVRAAIADLDSPIAVERGSASIDSPTGEQIVIEPGGYTVLSADGELSQPKRLPGRPRALSPADGATAYVSPDRSEIALAWDPDGCEQVRVELATDEGFAASVRDETTTATELPVMDLTPGEYFWRVRCLDVAALHPGPLGASRFAIVADGVAPRIEVVEPASRSIVTADTILARCRGERSLRVYINGELASEVAAGEYARRVRLSAGINRIVFEAVDDAGNAGRSRRYVTRAAE